MTVSVLYFRELETVISVQLPCHLRLFYTTVPNGLLTCGNLNCIYTKPVQQTKFLKKIFEMESRYMNKYNESKKKSLKIWIESVQI